MPLDIEGQNVPWSRIISDSSKFTALFPPGTITQEVDTAEDPDGAIKSKSYPCSGVAHGSSIIIFS